MQVGAYNLGVGASGTDPLNPNREMSSLERGTRIVGGTMGVASAPFSLGGRAFTNDALVLVIVKGQLFYLKFKKSIELKSGNAEWVKRAKKNRRD